MNEVEAAMQIGESIGAILVYAAAVPAAIAAPIVALFGLGSFLFGKKYERRWGKDKEKRALSIKDINEIVVPSSSEGDENGNV